MENASKALIIAGAILLSILIIGIGIYIFSSAQGTIDESIANMNTQEIEAFNSQFSSYSNRQSGSNVKALVGRLIGNFNTYQDEPGKVPSLIINGVTGVDGDNANLVYDEVDDDLANQFINGLSLLRNKLVNKRTYNVEFNHGTSGLITSIVIEDITNK